MADNKFKIEITADDKASGVLKDVGGRLDDINKPLKRLNPANRSATTGIPGAVNGFSALGKSLSAIGRNSPLGRLSGPLSDINKGLGLIGKRRKDLADEAAAQALERQNARRKELGLSPLEPQQEAKSSEIARGAGLALGGLAAAAVAASAAMIKVTTVFGDKSVDILNNARLSGLDTTTFQKLLNAGKFAGIPAEGMTGAIRAFGEGLNNANKGMDAQMQMAMKLGGVGIVRDKLGHVDVMSTFSRVMSSMQSGTLKGASLQTQLQYLNAMHLPSEMLMLSDMAAQRGGLGKLLGESSAGIMGPGTLQEGKKAFLSVEQAKQNIAEPANEVIENVSGVGTSVLDGISNLYRGLTRPKGFDDYDPSRTPKLQIDVNVNHNSTTATVRDHEGKQLPVRINRAMQGPAP